MMSSLNLSSPSLENLVNHTKPKVAFLTLGCRLNESESSSLADGFIQRGFDICSFGDKADITVINTCTVTDKADSSCRSAISKAHRFSPEGILVVTGCYAQMSPQEISQIEGVDLVLGTQEKFRIFDYLEEEQNQKIHIERTFDFWPAATSHLDHQHTRAFLKIQDGCNYICSFCIIPFARGRSRAMEPENVFQEARRLINNGFKEIVLTGVNIGEYEAQSGYSLAKLVQNLLKIESLERLRLSSVEPNTFTKDLIQVLKNSPKFMPHFHIPLQSGCDEILKKMRRKYDSLFYKNLIENILESFPQASFGADLITGYPGETIINFEQGFEFVKSLPLTHFHVFPYSKRKGTTAAREEQHVHYQEKKRRAQKLIDLGQQKLQKFIEEKVIGTRQKILLEKSYSQGHKNGYTEGLTPHFIRCLIPTESLVQEFGQSLRGQIIEVELHSLWDQNLPGEIGKKVVGKLVI